MEAEQQEEEAAEAEKPEADLTETGRGERSEEQSEDEEDKKQIVRYQTVKDRLGSPAPLAAGATSAAAAESAHRLSLLAGYTIPRVVSPMPKCYFESFPAPNTRGLYHQDPGDPAGEAVVRDPGGRRYGVVWQAGGELQQTAFPDREGENTQERGPQET